MAITASLSTSHSPASPLVTVTKLLPSITPLTPSMPISLVARGDFAAADSGVVKFSAPRGIRVRSTTYFRVLGLGVHSSWMFTDMPSALRPGRAEFNPRGSPGPRASEHRVERGNVASLPPPGGPPAQHRLKRRHVSPSFNERTEGGVPLTGDGGARDSAPVPATARPLPSQATPPAAGDSGRGGTGQASPRSTTSAQAAGGAPRAMSRRLASATASPDGHPLAPGSGRARRRRPPSRRPGRG